MIQILHGENTAASYKAYEALIQKEKDSGFSIVFHEEGNSVNQVLRQSEFFSEKRLIVIKNPKKLTKRDLAYLSDKKDLDALVYSDTKLSALVLSALGKSANVREYKLPKKVFAFLGGFKKGNTNSCLLTFWQLTEPPEFTIHLLAKLLSDMLLVKLGETLPYPSWRSNIIANQVKGFELIQIQKAITDLSEIDYTRKVGLSFDGQLETFIVKSLSN